MKTNKQQAELYRKYGRQNVSVKPDGTVAVWTQSQNGFAKWQVIGTIGSDAITRQLTENKLTCIRQT